MANQLVLLGLVLSFVYAIDACADRNGFHCIGGQWNCPLAYRNTVRPLGCNGGEHCCKCTDARGFPRNCNLGDLVETQTRPILVNPNFNCNWCNPGAFCVFQENLGLGSPDNGCSRGRRVRAPPRPRGGRGRGGFPSRGRFPFSVNNRFNRFRGKRDAEIVSAAEPNPYPGY